MGCQAWVKFSPTCFADVGERQTVVLVRHPDHTVGQARSTSVKPISGIIPRPEKCTTFSWAVVRPVAHELLLGNLLSCVIESLES